MVIDRSIINFEKHNIFRLSLFIFSILEFAH